MVVILGILAAIVVFAVSNLTGTSAQSACTSDQKTVQTAVEAYKAQVGHYPQAGDNFATAPGGTLTANAVAATTPGIDDLYTTQASGSGGAAVGPWLKTQPVNSGHYSITVTQDSNGTVGVDNSAGTAVIAGGCQRELTPSVAASVHVQGAPDGRPALLVLLAERKVCASDRPRQQLR